MRTFLFIASDGDVSEMPCNRNETNKYSTAVLTDKIYNEILCL